MGPGLPSHTGDRLCCGDSKVWELQDHGMVWFGMGLKQHPVPPLPRAGTFSTRPGCSKPCPWTFAGWGSHSCSGHETPELWGLLLFYTVYFYLILDFRFHFRILDPGSTSLPSAGKGSEDLELRSPSRTRARPTVPSPGRGEGCEGQGWESLLRHVLGRGGCSVRGLGPADPHRDGNREPGWNLGCWRCLVQLGQGSAGINGSRR